MTDNKLTRSSKRIIIIATIVMATILTSIIISAILHKNSQNSKDEFDSKQIYNDYIEINEEALDIEEKYATNGLIQPEDISTVLDELEVLAKEYESKGLITSYDKQATSIYFKLNSGLGYLYTPTVEELLAGDDVGKILTVEPYATSSEFVSNYLIGGKSPDKAAEKIVADLPDSYSFSKDDNWDSFSFEQVKQMSNHKIIIWYGHGGYVKEYGSVLGTSIPIKDQSSLLMYQLELSNGEMILGRDCFCISPSYFEKHLEENSLEGSLVFLGACQSAMDNRLAAVFINKGASLVVGNSQTIRIRYMLYMMDDFMSALTNQYDDGTYWTAEDALAYAKSQNGDSDSEFWAYGAEVKLIYPENKSGYRLYSNDDSKEMPLSIISDSNDSTQIESKFDLIEIGDIVSYGNYEQDGNTDNGAENIDWVVLEKEDDRMLLISYFALDCELYDSTHWWDMSWEICTLRQWLNNDFFDSAFNSEEKREMLSYTTESELSDNVFILNKDEYDQYLTDELKKCQATKYALDRGAYSAYNNNCFWWLRSVGEKNDSIPYIDYNGDCDSSGNAIRNSNYAVRPAIWVSSDANVKVRPSIDEMIDLILSHYNEAGLFTSKENYVIFNDEVIETTTKRTFIVRYQMTDEEAQEYLDRGSFPPANRCVTSVVVDMVTGKVSDEITPDQKWNIW